MGWGLKLPQLKCSAVPQILFELLSLHHQDNLVLATIQNRPICVKYKRASVPQTLGQPHRHRHRHTQLFKLCCLIPTSPAILCPHVLSPTTALSQRLITQYFPVPPTASPAEAQGCWQRPVGRQGEAQLHILRGRERQEAHKSKEVHRDRGWTSQGH